MPITASTSTDTSSGLFILLNQDADVALNDTDVDSGPAPPPNSPLGLHNKTSAMMTKITVDDASG